MSQSTNYVPGVCNINPKEVAHRRMTGYIGLITALALIAIFLAADFDRWFRIIIFVPAFLMATGFLQAKNKFCVGFAGSGMHHADSGQPVKISDKKSLLLDKLRARKINLQAFVIALLITTVVLVLPVLD